MYFVIVEHNFSEVFQQNSSLRSDKTALGNLVIKEFKNCFILLFCVKIYDVIELMLQKIKITAFSTSYFK